MFSMLTLLCCTLGMVLGNTELIYEVTPMTAYESNMELSFYVNTWTYGNPPGAAFHPCQKAGSEPFCYIDESIPHKVIVHESELSARYTTLRLKDVKGTIELLNLVSTPTTGLNVQIKNMKIDELALPARIRVTEVSILAVTGLNVPKIPLPNNAQCGNPGHTNCMKHNGGNDYKFVAENVDTAQHTVTCTRDAKTVQFGLNRYEFVDVRYGMHIELNGKLNSHINSPQALTNCEINGVTELPKKDLSRSEQCAPSNSANCFWFRDVGKVNVTVKGKGVSTTTSMKLAGTSPTTFMATFNPIKCSDGMEVSLRFTLLLLCLVTVEIL